MNSIGIISNGAFLKRVLPTDIHSHSITTDGALIRTINFRVLLAQRAVSHSQVQVFLNNARLQCNSEKGEVSANTTRTEQDYNACLNMGVNAFEVFVAASKSIEGNVISEAENYSVFINRL